MSIGPKRLVVGAHYGLKDWIAQRVTALILIAYTLILGVGLLLSPSPLQYEDWVHLFNWTLLGAPLGKLLAILAVLSVTYHAWIGVRDIWMDYVTATGIRLTLQVLTILWLAGSAVYAVLILVRV
jgi:succinate dehydrogenase / fumarate reductase membrane anchor subunit